MTTPVTSARFDRAEFEKELGAIAVWWLDRAVDRTRGGVFGEIGDDNAPKMTADKGAILHTRVLWFFSELMLVRPSEELKETTQTLYHYIVDYFVDREEGGLVWRVSADGAWLADRKQIYSQAFAIYALSAYARAFDDPGASELALNIAKLIEDNAWDKTKGGYVEAFARNWTPIEDWRLSERDMNSPKTMNTHLHVLEAYTGLHHLAGSDFSKGVLAKNIDIFLDRFVEPRGDSLSLFYSMDWEDECADESYGHDIEASWLLYEAAEVLDDATRLAKTKDAAIRLATAALDKAVDDDGALVYERHAETGEVDRRRHWWAQAEAMIGFYNAYQLTGDSRFESASARVWSFIKKNQIDGARGEWFSFSTKDQGEQNACKAGFWKGPYHNGRAMMEMMRRLGDDHDA